MNEETPLENGNYEVALSCFSAAFALHASGEAVKGEAIRNHVGQGSLTTTIRYARLWNALQQGEALNLSPVLRSAYEAAEGGHAVESPEAFEEDPPEELAELGLDLGKLITDKAWAFLQRVIQRETLSAQEEAEVREQAAFERAQAVERERDTALIAFRELEAECDRLQEVNATLHKTNQQMIGELKAVTAVLEDLKTQNHHTQKQIYQRDLELASLKEQKSNLDEALASERHKAKETETLRLTKIKLESSIEGLKSQLIQEKNFTEKLESNNDLLMTQLTKITAIV